jgi:hypothetical protein
MPISTAMFARKPRAKRMTRRMIASTMPATSRYPAAPKSADAAPPPAQLMPTRMSEMPIIVMIVPVTTEGKKGSTYLTKGATSSPKMPPTITAP